MKLHRRFAFASSLAFFAVFAAGQVRAQNLPLIENRMYASEERDWGIAPTSDIRTSGFHAPTPMSVPGVRTITTFELRNLLAGPVKAGPSRKTSPQVPPLLINVLDSKSVWSIPNSIWLSKAGLGNVDDATFAARLNMFTGGDLGRQLVFYCLSSECWLSYNATLRATKLGYRNVAWYRGGIEAWKAAGLPAVGAAQDRW